MSEFYVIALVLLCTCVGFSLFAWGFLVGERFARKRQELVREIEMMDRKLIEHARMN
jgi:hypothetical protein